MDTYPCIMLLIYNNLNWSLLLRDYSCCVSDGGGIVSAIWYVIDFIFVSFIYRVRAISFIDVGERTICQIDLVPEWLIRFFFSDTLSR